MFQHTDWKGADASTSRGGEAKAFQVGDQKEGEERAATSWARTCGCWGNVQIAAEKEIISAKKGSNFVFKNFVHHYSLKALKLQFWRFFFKVTTTDANTTIMGFLEYGIILIHYLGHSQKRRGSRTSTICWNEAKEGFKCQARVGGW